jgi:hypothetical protein
MDGAKTRRTTTLKALQILARTQDTPGAAIAASEVGRLDPTKYTQQPVLDVLMQPVCSWTTGNLRASIGSPASSRDFQT